MLSLHVSRPYFRLKNFIVSGSAMLHCGSRVQTKVQTGLRSGHRVLPQEWPQRGRRALFHPTAHVQEDPIPQTSAAS